ncbi:MAG: tRNA (adenosine(37)-N6)-threonylcarbamoyltransferase complex dimerization subunit type 1 TsaB [Bacteroidales bacterium]|nr:tRNA (adenosine(37)-N6)-threonylcarbamoyltransferase complex dimerization subunit type 1 TsaB [Bacteroidales bacterium]MDD3860032.1 tRNA (adenosine(37)-N6)-threonylcarbamoyltransferase complex dimerization subunit type 1 TsaB [Bacteroidales bacterium]
MAKILNIETSTDICSVSISIDGVSKFLKIFVPESESSERYSHSKLLAVFIDEILKENNILPAQIDAVAVSEGPGSYTGLRIGVSSAKGFAFGIEKPLIAVDTMHIIAKMAKTKTSEIFDYFIPMTDARRMEVYCSVFDKSLKQITPVEAKIITQESFENFKNFKTCFCGNGAEKCSEILQNKNFSFDKNIFPSAEFMGEFSEKKFIERDFVNIVDFEPYYLKDFIATTPKNKIL